MARVQVRARAVDLLGRQQVAGIPTAISELFKNAHDAYAHRVEVDFYRRRNIFIMRDDGVGMSRLDFEKRWLTLGTESKAEGVRSSPPPRDPGQPIRPTMGEKGIGRLAIALIGPQVLVLTRPKLLDPSLAKLTVAFLNWTLFSVPGVDLGDIEIPLVELPAGTLPNQDDIRRLTEVALENAVQLLADDPDALATVRGQIETFDLDLPDITRRLPDGPDLQAASGTQFWISPASELLPEDIDGARASDRATSFEKALLGFTNTMTPGHMRPPIETRFRDHTADGLMHERIADDNFFTPEEFEAADHHIKGAFDDKGQFSGSVQVYGKEPVPYLVHWPNTLGAPTDCGPIQIHFAYVQGNFRESRLPRDLWSQVISKLNKIGGIYVYRDGVRVLPYGDSDYDFLDVELRRNRGNTYYFFSYRRMFGVIEITRAENRQLVEKAGREGFQVNRAYRQFKSILENFLIQTAGDFFREGGANRAAFEDERDRLAREHELVEQRRKQISGRRKELAAALDAFVERMNDSFFERQAEIVLRDAERSFTTAGDQGLSYEALMGGMREAQNRLSALVRLATVGRPRGFGLTRDLSRQWSLYEVERQRLQEQCFNPTFERLDHLVEDAARRNDLSLDVRRMVGDVLGELGDRHLRRARTLQTEVQRNVGDLRERALTVARQGLQAVDATVRSTLISFEHTNAEELSSDNLQVTRQRLEQQIVNTAEEQTVLLERLRDQLKAAATPEALQNDDMVAALEGELEERRERDLESLQLAQMGMAIGIVHHEFHAVIRAVRQNVRRLKTWADRNSAMQSLYEDINRSYSHLDGYLSLFAPLNRRLSQAPAHIRGEEIQKYLSELLGERMERHGIKLEATEAFKRVEFDGNVSAIYPPFVNLVDNAFYWLTNSGGASRGGVSERSKIVSLDFVDGAFVISDTGPGILPADQDAVFRSGFSRKPGGSGLGLYITKTLLQQAGYDLTLDRYRHGEGATFRIRLPLRDEGAPEGGDLEA